MQHAKQYPVKGNNHNVANIRTLLAEIRHRAARGEVGSAMSHTPLQRAQAVAPRPQIVHFEQLEERKAFADSEFFVTLLANCTQSAPSELTTARCVVGCGFGASRATTFDTLEKLAYQLGGALGGTRPVVDRGLLPHDRMIGRTGCSITADYYLAFGISGQRLHTVGLPDGCRIVAINRDEEAPICREAEWVIVGDAEEVAAWWLSQLNQVRNNE